MSPADGLPHGFGVQLDARVRRLDGGSALLGGSPPRLLRLHPAAQTLLVEQPMRVRDARTADLARRLLDAGVAHPRPVSGAVPEEVTVIIPVRDNPAGVRRLLAAVDHGLAVIVVDDGSVSPTELAQVCQRYGAQLVRHNVSRGPGAARNTGLAQARTPYVAFLDSDVVPTPGWLPPLLAHLADPTVALVAPRITALAGARGWIARYEAVRSSLDLGPREAPVVPRSRVAYVPSAALVVRVSAARSVAPRCFDTDLVVAEDVDLCWRLHAQGWRLRYEPAARVAHQHRTDTRKWLARKAFYGTGAALLAARHPGQVPPVVLAPWTAAVGVLAISGTRGGLLTAGAVTVIAALRLSRTLHGLEHPRRAAAVLVPRALAGAGAQIASAACRSYWPPAVLLAAGYPRARRMLLSAAVLEGVADWVQHPGSGLGPARYVAAKRLDDLAYGAGLWWGAARAHSPGALLPSLSGANRRLP